MLERGRWRRVGGYRSYPGFTSGHLEAHDHGLGSADLGARLMSDKSPRNTMTKKAGKSLKEKRADKKSKAGGAVADDTTSAINKKR